MANGLRRFTRDGDGYVRWVRLTDTPLLVLSVVFVGVLLVPIVTTLSAGARTAFGVANVVIWAMFAVDYVVRLYLAHDRREYVKRNVIDLLVVVVPFLRPIRALRLLRLLRIGTVGGMLNRRVASLHARVTTYVVSAAIIAVLIASAGVYDAEHEAPNGNIKNFGDALWWSMSTIATAGYGDRYPTTTYGRLIAVALMIFGIALLGVITASIAAWFVGRLQDVESEEKAETMTLDHVLAEVQNVRAEIRQLNERLDAMGTPAPARKRRARQVARKEAVNG